MKFNLSISFTMLFFLSILFSCNSNPVHGVVSKKDSANIIQQYLNSKKPSTAYKFFDAPDSTSPISEQQALEMINMYIADPLTEMPTIPNEPMPINSFFIEKRPLEAVLVNPRFVNGRGFRIYLGKKMDANNNKILKLILVGVDRDGKNIKDMNCILDDFNTCPPRTNCPPPPDTIF